MESSIISKRFDNNWKHKIIPTFNNPSREKLRRSFMAELQKGIYKTEYTPCYCGSYFYDPIASIDKHRINSKVVICKQCGLLRNNPRLT